MSTIRTTVNAKTWLGVGGNRAEGVITVAWKKSHHFRLL
jgi:hypothetical protein